MNQTLETGMQWLAANSGNAGFIAYCACLALFAWAESAAPAFRQPRLRQQRWPTNFGIGILNVGLMLITPVTAVVAARWTATQGIGLLNVMHSPLWLAVFATVVVRSFAGYILHVLMHKVGLLWRIHRIHHCDTHIDVSTSLRNHPLELVVLILFTVPVAVLFGFNPWALAAFELFESLTNFFAHANIRLPETIDRSLRWLFVTPNMHCLHHSSFQPETDSNYGEGFSFWDRLFGTYSAAPRSGYDAMQIGLKEIGFDRASDIVWQMRLPAITIEKAEIENEKPLRAERGKA